MNPVTPEKDGALELFEESVTETVTAIETVISELKTSSDDFGLKEESA